MNVESSVGDIPGRINVGTTGGTVTFEGSVSLDGLEINLSDSSGVVNFERNIVGTPIIGDIVYSENV